MVQVDLSALLKHLNPETKLALEQAASLCISQQGGEITVSHWFLTLLENPVGDFRTLLKLANIDVESVKNALTKTFSRQSQTLNPYPSFSPLLIDLIKEAWTLGSVELNHQQVRSGVLILCALLNAPRYLPLDAIELFEKVNREALRKDFDKLFSNTSEQPATDSANHTQDSITSDSDSALKKFAHDFTQMARDGRIDPVLCRDAEIDQMIDILTRRRKNNPIAVGDAGVGKSALVEGLAQRIVDKRVPKSLHEVSLWGLDMGALQAGASVKGEFEKRLKAVIDEVKNSSRPIILFIDEAHTLIGAGNNAGGSDAANLLKPALARGELKTIAATTWSEYKKYFEKDPALSRRFQLVKLEEPTIEQAIHIIRGLRPIYEKAHKVYISDDAVHAAANMSARFITGRQLPDKAIDVLDTACARVATALAEPPRKLSSLENKRIQTTSELNLLERDALIGKSSDTARIQELKDELENIQTQKEQLQQAWTKQKVLIEEIQAIRAELGFDLESADIHQTEKSDLEEEGIEGQDAFVEGDNISSDKDSEGRINTVAKSKQNHDALTQQIQQKVAELLELQKGEALLHADVGAEQIAQVISDWTGVPATTISADRMNRLKSMPKILGDKVRGQDEGIAQIHRHLLTSMADLKRPGTPLGAFLFVGPSGVGKTETARVLAEDFFGGNQFLTSINMSEYQEKHTVSRLLGSPPGYVGFGEGGLLTEAIRQKPYSVVLLDEVDKAHPEVLNVFYQVFDKGVITDGEGQLINCQNILFLLTSNIGFDMVEGALDEPDEVELRKKLMEFFKPALLARMQVVLFKHLDEHVLAEIVDMRLEAVQKQVLKRYKANLILKDEVKEELKSRCIRHENGARMLDASIDGELLPPLSLSILEYLAKGESFDQVTLDWDGNRFNATVSNA